MNPFAFRPGHPPFFHPQPPMPPTIPPMAPSSSSFWTKGNVQDRVKDLKDTIDLSRALKMELDMLAKLKEGNAAAEIEEHGGPSLDMFSNLRFQLEPFRNIVDDSSPWEEKSALRRLADKVEKYKKNKVWRKRKRRRIAENLAREREKFDLVNKEVDEWRERENAKDIAQRKIEKMKAIAKNKAKEEKKKLQSDLDLVLIVEKLQELRKIRIQKLKKQGHFFPEEDDKFLERVRAAVEEEERQLIAAADTGAAKDAIAAVEESRKNVIIKSHASETEANNLNVSSQDQNNVIKGDPTKESGEVEAQGRAPESSYDYASQLPLEFYHYYHGSNADLGTLIEVRRQWDAFLRPGGSRIPGHWVQPPPPADDVWGSYLIRR